MPVLPTSLIERFKQTQHIRDLQDEGDLDASLEVTVRETLRKIKLRESYGLPEDSAFALAVTRATAGYFVACVDEGADPKQTANWILGDVFATLNRENIDIENSYVGPDQLAFLLKRIADGTISNKIAKEVFNGMWEAKSDNVRIADEIIESKGLKQISDSSALEKIVDEVLAANAKSVEEFRAGKEQAINALMGQAMKASKGKANPAQLTELLKKKLTA